MSRNPPPNLCGRCGEPAAPDTCSRGRACGVVRCPDHGYVHKLQTGRAWSGRGKAHAKLPGPVGRGRKPWSLCRPRVELRMQTLADATALPDCTRCLALLEHQLAAP